MNVGELKDLLNNFWGGDEVIVQEPPYKDGRTPRRYRIIGHKIEGALILTTESIPGESKILREEQIARAERARERRAEEREERKREIERIKDPEKRRKARERMKRKEESYKRKLEKRKIKRKEARRASTSETKQNKTI